MDALVIRRRLRGLIPVVIGGLALALGGSNVLPARAAHRAKVAYVPGVALAAEVMLPDGTTPRAYQTPKGLSPWTSDLPIQQGDKIKLSVFAATGGSELKEIKVRLDNTKIADLTAAPWSTVIDTAALPAGPHMIEVWAQGTGDRPQSSTKTLSFSVAKQLPVQYAVKGSQQVLQGGTVTTVPLEPSPADPNAIPDPPDFLKGQPTDEAAQVSVVSSATPSGTAQAVGDDSLTITQPTYFSAQGRPGGTATQFAYVLTRNGNVINAAARPFRLDSNVQKTEIRIQRRTDTTAGLAPGAVTLWVWGIDKEGHPGAPVKAQLIIPE